MCSLLTPYPYTMVLFLMTKNRTFWSFFIFVIFEEQNFKPTLTRYCLEKIWPVVQHRRRSLKFNFYRSLFLLRGLVRLNNLLKFSSTNVHLFEADLKSKKFFFTSFFFQFVLKLEEQSSGTEAEGKVWHQIIVKRSRSCWEWATLLFSNQFLRLESWIQKES